MSNKIFVSLSLVFLLIGSGCVKTSIPVSNSPVLETPTEIIDQNVIDTSNWKTATNEACNFSFQYPSDWTVIDSENSSAVLSLETAEEINTDTPEILPGFDFSASCFPDIKTFITQHNENLSDSELEKIKNLTEYIVANIVHPYGPFFSLFESMRISDQKAYRVTLLGNSVSFAVWFEYQGRVLELIFPDIENPNQLSSIQQEILNSFRITQ